ncbi:MAG: metallo-mystery pair system four-Cys motif protein [Chloroflexi bacterium]|nr:metallo-mystery pair system four-Cys motif protein [Chloroflexota bacterium]
MNIRRWGMLILLAVLMLSVGAAAAQDHSGGNDGHGGMMMSGLPTVGPNVTIRFAAMAGDRPASCGMIYMGMGVDGATVSLNDFRFYVSNVRLINAAGEEVPVELAQDGLWQYANVALLDFEDGTSMCSEAGNADMNDKIVGMVPEGEYTGLIFDLGVPFELNHLDTTTAPAPLNLPAMWWNWQAGYKFVRIDLQTPQSQTPAWYIHLGSTVCESADSSTPPSEMCKNANINTVRLDDFDAVHNFVVADVAGLLAAVNVNESTPMPPGCMSGLDDPDCPALFSGFGLDIATGGAVEGTQTFFRVG